MEYMLIVSSPRWKWKLPISRGTKKRLQTVAKRQKKLGFDSVIEKYDEKKWERLKKVV